MSKWWMCKCGAEEEFDDDPNEDFQCVECGRYGCWMSDDEVDKAIRHYDKKEIKDATI